MSDASHNCCSLRNDDINDKLHRHWTLCASGIIRALFVLVARVNFIQFVIAWVALSFDSAIEHCFGIAEKVGGKRERVGSHGLWPNLQILLL